jgi:peptidoglycan/xylan/chitin deacetylase (PgdA/CDA1 family)
MRRQTSRRSRGVVLLYHRVAEPLSDTHGLCVSPSVFAAQAAYIAATCQTMSLEQIIEDGVAGELPPRAVAVTFDDGYQDCLAAFEILDGFNIPFTLFMTSAQLDQPHAFHYWWDVLDWAVLTPGVADRDLRIQLAGETQTFQLGSESERVATHRALHTALLELDADTRDHALAPLYQLRETHRPTLPRRISRAELLEAAEYPGIRIGLHTEHHLMLPAHPAARQQREVAANLHALEGLLGGRISTLAYPFGAWAPATAEIADSLGVAIAVTTAHGAVGTDTHRLSVPRADVAAFTSPFEQQLGSLFADTVPD